MLTHGMCFLRALWLGKRKSLRANLTGEGDGTEGGCIKRQDVKGCVVGGGVRFFVFS